MKSRLATSRDSISRPVDYFAAICYDPEIQGYLDETCTVNGEGTLGYQEDRGFADWIPASVYNRSISGYRPDRFFTSLGEHWVRDWYYGTRSYHGYTAVCTKTPPDFCELKTENGTTMAVPCPTPIITPTPSPSPTPPTVQIQEVGFTGDHLIRRFPVTPERYVDKPDGTTPTWVRGDSSTEDCDPVSASHCKPVAYKKGIDPKIFAKLSINPVAATSINALLRVKKGGQEITAQNASLTLSANSNTATLSNLTIRAGVLENFTDPNQARPKKAIYDFDWELSLDNGQSWKSIGRSRHIIFWTYGDVVEPVGCELIGPTNRDCLFLNNGGRREWPGLYDRALAKALGEPEFTAQTPDEIANFLATEIDDQIDYNPSNRDADLVHPLNAYDEGDGVQCSVNANLLRGLLRSIGINNAETVYLWGGKPDNTDKRESLNGGLTYGWKVRKWNTGATPPFIDNYYTLQAVRPASNEGSVSLQNDPNFTFHAMVKVFNEPDTDPNNLAARYYDPSYAKRLEANPTRYPHPYVNSSLSFKKIANLDVANPKDEKFVEAEATIPFIVRAIWLNNFCLPREGEPPCPATTKIMRRVSTTTASVLPRTSVFDSQGSAMFAVWRPSDGVWYMHNPFVGTFGSRQFGVAGDLPAPGDYDGDGVTDYAVFRPSDSTLYVFESSEPAFRVIPWTSGTDLPISGDFDGDGKSDIAYYREGTDSQWFITRSSTGVSYSETFGIIGDKPISGDFDGDGKTDVAVFRPSNATWYWRRSTDGIMYTRNYGVSGDIIVPGDYDADGITDFVVYRQSTNHWYVLLPASNSFYGFLMGSSGDIPVPGDYDGDLKSDFALWNQSTGRWVVINSSDGTTTEAYWGVTGDKPSGAAFLY